MSELMKNEHTLENNFCNVFALLMSNVTLIPRIRWRTWPSAKMLNRT